MSKIAGFSTLTLLSDTEIYAVAGGRSIYQSANGGSAVGIGAALSTTIAGLLYDWIGSSAAFYGLSGLAAAGLTLAYLTFSETRPDVD